MKDGLQKSIFLTKVAFGKYRIRMTKVTIIDVAKALGTTPSTVSRALAGNPHVKDSTRRAVQEKAEEMGYERNIIASNLRRGKAHAVGIVVPRINRTFFSTIISTAEYVLEKAGYSVIICQSHENEDDEIKALKTLSGIQVGGLIISHSLGTKTGDHLAEFAKGGTKLVQFDRVFPGLPGSTVTNDDFEGAYEATMHLIRNGYKRIGAFTGPLDANMFLNRYNGYKEALSKAGLPIDEDIVFQDTIVRDTGYSNAAKAVERGCDALYCSGDYSALGAFEYVTGKGLGIPVDFGIVGTANEDFTSLISPSMSSIEQNPAEIGEKAAEALLRLLNDETEGEDIIVKTRLVSRESSDRKAGKGR